MKLPPIDDPLCHTEGDENPALSKFDAQMRL
jgi:hypothetical protein